ncbi:hypothetical protein J5N97_000443, partial [Dioscorea zingiberensis]
DEDGHNTFHIAADAAKMIRENLKWIVVMLQYPYPDIEILMEFSVVGFPGSFQRLERADPAEMERFEEFKEPGDCVRIKPLSTTAAIHGLTGILLELPGSIGIVATPSTT